MRLGRLVVVGWWRCPWPIRFGIAAVLVLIVWQWRWWLVGGISAVVLVGCVWRFRHVTPRVPLPQRWWTAHRLLVRWRWMQAARASGLVGPRDAPADKQRPPAVRVTRTRSGWALAFNPPRGMSPEDVRRAADAVASAYGVPASVAGVLDVTVTLRSRDSLADPVPWSKVPPAAADLTGGLPIALSEHGSTIALQQAHTLIVGATGSGKGSALWALVRALEPAARENLVRFIGLDSKASEVRQAERLFCEYAYTAQQHADVLADLASLIGERGEQHTGREFAPTPDEPLIVVVLDEITSLTSIFKDAKQRNAALADLRIILSLGRSRGVLVVGAGQDPTKDALALRDLFPQRVALRLANATETRLVLGEGAAEAGAEPHTIPVASRSNGYKSAGTAFVQDDTGQIVRCRLPFTSDEDLAALCERLGDHTSHGCTQDRETTPTQPEEVAS